MTVHQQTPYVEIETTEELLHHLAQGRPLEQVVVQGLDLSAQTVEEGLVSVRVEGASFLGCRMTPRLTDHIRQTGGTIFPAFPGLPFHPYRSTLYTAEELMAGYVYGERSTLEETIDGQIYAYFSAHRNPEGPMPVMVSLAYRIHDHAIDDALHDLLYPEDEPPKRVVAVMGGHGMHRDSTAYRQVTQTAWELAQRGYFIASGGGPGAMEAANLGAYLCRYQASDVDRALRLLAEQPYYTDPSYVEKAYDVLARYPDAHPSLAVPTWFYGHEPTNLFSLHVAKYFANSIREDGLLAIAKHGVIYAPGSAGTIQEIFMDVAQNHYVTFGAVSPMVFLGTTYWTQTKPVYPLLQRLAEGQPYAQLLTISDEVEDVVRFVVENHPVIP